LLPDGKVLLIGGWNGTSALASAEMFDPTTQTFSLLANGMTSARETHTATVLANGKILIAGGDTNGSPLKTAELFDPMLSTFTTLAPDTMTTPRRLHSAALLPNGIVLLTGGFTNGQQINAAELYNGPVPSPVQLHSVVSRMTHGSAGTFDVDLPLTGNPGIECRANVVSGNCTLVFSFANVLTTVAMVNVTDGTGSVANSGIDPGDRHNYVVNLTGVSNEQFVTVTLGNVGDAQGKFSSAVSATMGVLLGDTNGDGLVNVGDTIQTKSQSGSDLTNSNFRADVNTDGLINVGDTVTVSRQSGAGLPAQSSKELPLLSHQQTR
jgi:hypothetical protein